MSHCLIYVTVPSKKEAQLIAKKLLALRLVACVNILGRSDSYYMWKAKVEKSAEWIVICKTRKALFAKAQDCIKKNHSYQVPAILELPVPRGDKTFLNWINHETRR